ncbi:MAG: transporter substrate-binding domain-containing protein [Synergistaceae bacterium]|nr:transporter substrate-binding domain-containing protein [Synergistaceae bacterium]
MLKKFSVITASVILFVLCAFFTFLTGEAAASVMDREVVVVGTEGTYPPFEFYDEDNNLTGFDIEMVKSIGKKIGKEIQMVDMPFDGLIPALLTGKIDLIASAVTATEERRQRVNFSDVYHVTDATIVVRTGDDTIKGFADLRGKTIGVQLGTVEDLYLTNLDLPWINVKRYQKTDDAVREVLLGRNDGVFLDTVVGANYVDSEKFKGFLQLVFREEIHGPEEGFSLAVRKDDPRLLDAINGALREMESSGEMDALRKKYRM